MSRHDWFAAAATAAVVAGIVLGFTSLGSPQRQRERNADLERAGDLRLIATTVSQVYHTDTKLPERLDALIRYNPGLRLRDPVTNASYEYIPGSGSEFQLCATFAEEASPAAYERFRTSIFGFHKAGPQCFHLDAVRTNLTQ
jgi:hypothetical protein